MNCNKIKSSMYNCQLSKLIFSLYYHIQKPVKHNKNETVIHSFRNFDQLASHTICPKKVNKVKLETVYNIQIT